MPEAGVGLEIDQPVESVHRYLPSVDRVLVMGTAIGVKGEDQDANAPARVAQLVATRGGIGLKGEPEIVVDGGIRAHTVEALSRAGADGVVPGSLVFSNADPAEAVRSLQALGPVTRVKPIRPAPS